MRTFCRLLVVFLCVIKGSVSSSQLIVIEGMPGAGKTTALLNLINRFPKQVVVIPELNPEPDSTFSKTSIEEQSVFFHELWIERLVCLDQVGPEYCFLLDRNYISNLAYTYALDKAKHTCLYPNQKERTLKDLHKFQPSLFFVLDVDPIETICRKANSDEYIPWPFMEEEFLKAFREFYFKELPLFCLVEPIYINTEQLTEDEVSRIILEKIVKVLDANFVEEHKPSADSLDETTLLSFGEELGLGSRHSDLRQVLGRPTIYFTKHAVQLDESKKPVFFNNKVLRELLLKKSI